MFRKIIFILTIIAASLISGNLVSSYGAWQEVRQQGWRTDFREIFFIDSQNGWSVGSRGIIIHTSDGGKTWEEQYNAVTHSLEGLHFVDRNNGWAVGSLGVILHTTDGGKTWIPQISGAINNLFSVHFIDSNNGWAAGYDTILRTFDGGKSWIRQFLVQQPPFWTQLQQLTNTHFVSSKEGWVVGGAEHWIQDRPWEQREKGGIILKTTDGFNWVIQIFNSSVSQFEGVHFVDASTGWVVGGNRILNTTNGGQTWTSQEVGDTVNHLTSVHFIDKTFGWAVGFETDKGGIVFRTQDGGKTWVKQDIVGLPLLYDVYFANASNGWTVGLQGSIFYTSDGGNSWQAQVQPIHDFTSVHLINNREGWATTAGGSILHTMDGGVIWEAQEETRKSLNDIFFADSRHGWAVGINGTIYYTNDSGQTWQLQNSSSTAYLRGVQFIDTNQGWIHGEFTFLRTMNGGQTWELQFIGFSPIDAHFVSPNEGWALTEKSEILHTTDGGRIWFPQPPPTLPFGSFLRQIQFLDANNGWAVGSFLGGVVILRTTNGGQKWDLNVLQPPVDSVGTAIAHFASPNEGWIAVGGKGAKVLPISYKQFIYHTSDGGTAWEIEYQKESINKELLPLSDLHYADGVALLVGWGGTGVKNIVDPTDTTPPPPDTTPPPPTDKTPPPIDTTPPMLTEVKADSTILGNGRTLTLTVKSNEAGLKVQADISALDTTQAAPIAFTESGTETGTYRSSVVISEKNTAKNGPKTLKITVADAAGNLTEATLTVELRIDSVFSLSIPKGISPIHIPLKVVQVNDRAMEIRSIGDLYDAIGADNVRFLITYQHPKGQTPGGWNSFLGERSRGTAADPQITDDMGIFAVMNNSVTLNLKGNALGENGVSQIHLHPGTNLVGIPLRDERLKRLSDLFSLEGFKENATAIIALDSNDGKFKVVAQAGDDGDLPITSGSSFIITARREGVATISGEGWDIGLADVAAPPLVIVEPQVERSTPVLAVYGDVSSVKENFQVTVKNLSTGASLSTPVDSSGRSYSVTFVDALKSRAAQVGDVLEVAVETLNPFIGIQPLRYTVSTGDVRTGLIRLPDLIAYKIPRETQLLANYPNPFNPETWIPYRLAEDAAVTLTIYDMTGAVVRTLEVGHKPAAVYESRDEAIYWDGRNGSGERVASGVYFYTLTADDFTATRKMLVIK